MPKYMVKRIFPVWLAKSTRTLSSRLVQVGRTDIMPNGNIAVFINPFYLEHEFHRKPTNFVNVDRTMEGDFL